MNPIKRLAAPVLAAAWLIISTVAVVAAPVKITFLHTNDVYEISPKGGQGGLAELMTLLKQERAANPNTITTFGGDLLSPSVMSGLTKGSQMIELYNLLGTDVAVPGNHEFDFGPDVAETRFSDSTFTWLAANMFGANGGMLKGVTDIRIIETGGMKVGFFGVLTPDTAVLSSPGSGITFAPVVETAKAAVKKLQDGGAELIVAMTHLSLSEDREVARSVGGIHLILGGHDHNPITFMERDVLIHKSGYDAHYLGAIDIYAEWVESRGRKKLAVRPQWRMISTAGVSPDADIQAVVDGHEKKLDDRLGIVIGKTSVELDSRRASVRGMETNMGNLIADALREGTAADVAITNGGGIRGDKTYEAGSELTRKDILSELPFGNVTVLMELKGSDLKAALENGVSQVEDVAGRFPHVSGLTFAYDPKAPAGSRVTEVMVGGKALDANATYKVATNDYMAGGGDGYAALTKGKMLIDASGATLMATTVMNFVEAQGSVAPQVEGRITAR